MRSKIKLRISGLLLIVSMAITLWVVIQDTVWLAPPYLYQAVDIKFWLLFIPLPVLLICMWWNRDKLGTSLVGCGLDVLITLYVVSALIAYIGFMKPVPYSSLCQSDAVDENSTRYICRVHPWIDAQGEYIYSFEHKRGNLFMYVIDRQWKPYPNTSEHYLPMKFNVKTTLPSFAWECGWVES